MESKTISQNKNPFLKREEIILEIKNPSTPTSEEIKSIVGKDKNLTIIKKINTNFGSQKFIAEIVVYDNTESKKEIETIPQKTRKKIEAEEKAKAEAETKPEETKKAISENSTNNQEPITNNKQEENKPEEKTE